jgi:hypothetical protein
MVHALTEAHRVLKSNGILIDLRPAARHRRIGLGAGKQWKFIGAMQEPFDDDYAADRAVKQILRDGFFRKESQTQFMLDRVMDNLQDFRTWFDDFPDDITPSQDVLYKKVERAVMNQPAETKITVRGPLRLGVLRKISRDHAK